MFSIIDDAVSAQRSDTSNSFHLVIRVRITKISKLAKANSSILPKTYPLSSDSIPVLQSRSLLPSTTVSSTATTTYFTSTAAFITHSMTFSSTTPGDIAASTAASTAPSTDAAAAAAATTIFAYSVFTNQTNAIQPAKVRPALPSVCSPLPIF